mmetsp:Transcript_7300/g.22942  ORF Transcript_7300/g.22942 Transcript_7300/m.22942 type:complete len:146 (+) Transcript_7300:124-561(+)
MSDVLIISAWRLLSRQKRLEATQVAGERGTLGLEVLDGDRTRATAFDSERVISHPPDDLAGRWSALPLGAHTYLKCGVRNARASMSQRGAMYNAACETVSSGQSSSRMATSVSTRGFLIVGWSRSSTYHTKKSRMFSATALKTKA